MTSTIVADSGITTGSVMRQERKLGALGCALIAVSLSVYACGTGNSASLENSSEAGGSDSPGSGKADSSSAGRSAKGAGGSQASSTNDPQTGSGGRQSAAEGESSSGKGGSQAGAGGNRAGAGGNQAPTAGTGGDPSGVGGQAEAGGPSGTGGGRTTPLPDGGRGTGDAGRTPGSGGSAGGGSPQTGGRSDAGAGAPLPSKSEGCGVEPPTDSGSIDVGGQTAKYLLSVPKNYDKNTAYPIMFAFHGAGVEPSKFVTYFNMPSVAGNEAIVVTPECLGAASAWSESRDLPLFDALLQRMQSQYCVDNTRIFVGGHSSGGMFSHALGCRRGTLLRGIAALSAGPPSGTCTGEPAVWISQGTQDTAVTVDRGRAARDFWAKRNHCDTSQSTPVDPSPTVEYGGCDPGSAVRYCEYEGTHNLPSYAPKGLWDFFKSL